MKYVTPIPKNIASQNYKNKENKISTPIFSLNSADDVSFTYPDKSKEHNFMQPTALPEPIKFAKGNVFDLIGNKIWNANNNDTRKESSRSQHSHKIFNNNIKKVPYKDRKADSLTINSSSLSYLSIPSYVSKVPRRKNDNAIRSFSSNNTLNLARPTTGYILDNILGRPTMFPMGSTSLGETKVSSTVPPVKGEDESMTTSNKNSNTIKNNSLIEEKKQYKSRLECLDAPMNHGKCSHLINLYAWSYKKELDDCFEFAYSGCGSSRNIFWDKKDCLKYCVRKPMAEYKPGDNIINENSNEQDDKSNLNVYDEYLKEKDDNSNEYHYKDLSFIEEDVGDTDGTKDSNRFQEDAKDEDNVEYEIDLSHVMPVWDRENFVKASDNRIVGKTTHSTLF
jgi:hypothetical protein